MQQLLTGTGFNNKTDRWSGHNHIMDDNQYRKDLYCWEKLLTENWLILRRIWEDSFSYPYNLNVMNIAGITWKSRKWYNEWKQNVAMVLDNTHYVSLSRIYIMVHGFEKSFNVCISETMIQNQTNETSKQDHWSL